MYVAVKGGERAILNSQKLLDETRRGDTSCPELTPGADRASSLRSRSIARCRKARCTIGIWPPWRSSRPAATCIEAIFLLRAYRTTLPRFGHSEPIDTARMQIRRRISATFKDLPGGQLLGPTFDYTHRLLDFGLAEPGSEAARATAPTAPAALDPVVPRVVDLLDAEGLIEPERPDPDGAPVGDLTRDPLRFPADRAVRLQGLARGDEGFLLSLGYSTQRGYGRNHPFAGEIRLGEVAVEFTPPELGFPIEIGEITVTECQMVNQFAGSQSRPPQFTRGYGLVVRPLRAQDDVDGARRPRPARRASWRRT